MDPWDNMTIHDIDFDLDTDDNQLTFDFSNTMTTSSITNAIYTGSLSGNTLPSATYGSGGGVLSTSLTGNLMPAYPYSYGYNDTITITQPAPKSLHVNGEAVFEEDITVKGVKLSERLDAIEERLAILRPNNDLENRWQQLKELGEEYRKLEKEILEKERMWDMLKK